MRKVLSIWKVLLIIFASFVGVGGLTTLGVYITGGFNEKVVNPSDIYFSHAVDGEGNYNGTTNQFEISNSAKLTILTSTADVTKTKVTLSFVDENGRPTDQQKTEGFISNGIVRIPEIVQLNKEFMVEVLKEDNYVIGGTSYIMAKSENIEITSIRTAVAVDVPVEQIELDIENANKEGNVYQVVVDTNFSVDTTFTPTRSQARYGDQTRQKQVYFTATNGVEYNETTGEFAALSVTSGTEYTRIFAYAFAKAYYQEKYFAEHPTASRNEIVSYLASHPQECVGGGAKIIEVQIVSVDVDNVNFSIGTSQVNAYVDRELVVTTNSSAGDRTLGARVLNRQGAVLTALLGRVGMRVPAGTEGLSILGGRVVKETSTGITFENFDETKNYFEEEDGVAYYILPNTAPALANDYYWSFISSDVIADTQIKLNFFYEENGEWVKFFEDDNEPAFIFAADQHSDVAVGWKNTDAVNMTISFDATGKAISSSVDLSKLLGTVDSENVYKTVKYFLIVEDARITADVQTVFDCKAGVEYTGAEISQAGESYTLYELDSEIFTVLKSVRGVVKVIPVIVKTNTNGIPYKTGEKYQIVSAGIPKEIIIDSNLSIENMHPSFFFTSDEEAAERIVVKDGVTYLPSVNKATNSADEDITLVYFDLTLDSDDVAGDIEKVNAAYADVDKLLKIVCLDQNDQEIEDNYVYLDSLWADDDNTTAEQAVFKGKLAINSNLFNLSNAYNGIDIKLQLQYTDGETGTVYTKTLTQKDDDLVDTFKIYYQKPESVEGKYVAEGRDIEDPIVVDMRISGGISITWTTDDILTSVAELNNLLSFSLIDQFDKEIRTTDKEYSIRFVEEEQKSGEWVARTDKALEFFGATISNILPQGGATLEPYMAVYVYDKDGQRVTYLDTQRFAFQISGEGLSGVQYYDSSSGEYVDSESLSEITVRISATSDTTITLDNLFKIFTTTGEVDKSNNPYTIMLDSTYVATFGNDASKDMMKMLAFNGEDWESGDTLRKFERVDLTEIKVNAPFRAAETPIKLNIVDANNLYSIKLNLILTSNIETTPDENKLEIGKFAAYLSTDPAHPTALNVVSGGNYDLNECFAFSNNEYDWSNAVVTEDYSENEAVVKFDAGKIKILQTNKNELVNIKIYYGIVSQYAYCLDVNFYVHPNIALLEVKDFVNLQEVANGTGRAISSYYKLIQLRSYVEDGSQNNYTISSVEYTNVTEGSKYIAISQSDIVFENTTLNYQFGTRYMQTFTIQQPTLNEPIAVDFVLIDKNGQVTLFNKGEAQFEVQIGLESSDENATIESIIPNARVVTYNREKTVILVAGESYSLGENYNVIDGSLKEDSLIRVDETDTNKIRVYQTIAPYFVDDEVIGISTSLTQGRTITINLVLNAIVTRIGDIFVNYSSHTTIADEEFDPVEQNDFAHVLFDYEHFGNRGIYQELEAGRSYQILSNSTITYSPVANLDIDVEATHYVAEGSNYVEITLYDNEGNEITEVASKYYDNEGNEITRQLYENRVGVDYGFHFNKTKLGGSYTAKVTIVSQTLDGLATIVEADNNTSKLVLNHMSTELDNQFIVLKLEFANVNATTDTFAYYYAVLVRSSFEAGSVNYPYSNNAEYLDIYSEYYDKNAKSYTINMEEEFVEGVKTESLDKARFVESDDVTSLKDKYEYSIVSVKVNGTEVVDYSNYLTLSLSQAGEFVIDLVNETAKYDITISKEYLAAKYIAAAGAYNDEETYYQYLGQGIYQQIDIATQDEYNAMTGKLYVRDQENSTEMLGSALYYTFKINQSTAYAPEVAHYMKSTSYNSEIEYYTYDSSDKTYTSVGTISQATYDNGTYFEYVHLVSKSTANREYTASMIAGGNNEIFDLKLFIDSNGTHTRVTRDNYDFAVVGNLDNEGNSLYAESIAWDEDDAERLIVTPKNTIAQNGQITILFYTNERVAFKIIIDVRSYYSYSQNKSNVSAGTSETVEALLNITDERAEPGEINHTISVVDETQAPFVRIETEEGYTTGITFAYSTTARQITFRDTVNGEFNFEFTLNVSNVNPFTRNNLEELNVTRYGMVEFDKTVADFNDVLAARAYGVNSIGVVSFDDAGMAALDANDDTLHYENSTLTITPENVATMTEARILIPFVYIFDAHEETRIEQVVRFVYKAYPNVTISTNYPNPDKLRTNAEEYLTTDAEEGAKIHLLGANGKADFADAARFVWEYIPTELTEPNDASILVSINSISNASVAFGTQELTTMGDFIGITNNAEAEEAEFTLKLLDESHSGFVVFGLTVNEVLMTYRVDLVAENTIKIVSYSPNYANNHEVIYAEDLHGFEDAANLFESNRILHMVFSNTDALGNTYYIRLERPSQPAKIVKVLVDTVLDSINIDMGNGLTMGEGDDKYVYQGTYASKSAADSGILSSSITNLYSVEPQIKSRLMFTYYNDRPIEDMSANVFRAAEDADEEQKFEGITSDDYEYTPEQGSVQDVELVVYMKSTGDETEDKGTKVGTYNILPATEFDVLSNADDYSSYTYATIDANLGADLSLLENFTSFRITNTRLGLLYTPELMAASAGDLSVHIYGFSDLPVTEAGTPEVYKFHQHLDITPRATMSSINVEGSGGVTTYNYITLSATTVSGKNGADWLIRAQGARNEGDYVMMQIKYTVTFNAGTESNQVDIIHNVLFQVLPNAMVSLGGQGAGEERVDTGNVEGNLYASNKANPILINNNPAYIDSNNIKWNERYVAPTADDYTEAGKTADIIARLYGNTGAGGNNASTARFTYTQGVTNAQYNKSNTFDLTKTDTWEIFRMKDLTLGQLDYYIEGHNSFNYKIRLYYRLIGDINPSMTLSDTTLLEGKELAFSSTYTVMTAANTITIADPNAPAQTIRLQTYSKYYDTTQNQETDLNYQTLAMDAINAAVIAASDNLTNKNWSYIYSHYKGAPTAAEVYYGTTDMGLYMIVENATYTLGGTSETGMVVGKLKYDSTNHKYEGIAETWYNTTGAEVVFDARSVTNYAYGLNIGSFAVLTLGDLRLGSSSGNALSPTYYNFSTEKPTVADFVSGSGLEGGFLANFTGMTAFGFAGTAESDAYIGLASERLINKSYTSKFTQIRVENISLSKDDWTVKAAAEDLAYSSAKQFYTNTSVNYYNGTSMVTGLGAQKTNGISITIPKVSGLYYGTSNIISGVTLTIYITDGSQHGEIKETVAISRELVQNLLNSTVYDGEEAQKVEEEGVILNDTLEVVLESGASVSFNLQETATGAGNEMGETITLSNTRPYTVTEYVGISANSKHTGVNLKNGDSVSILNIEKTDGVTFRYNGDGLELTEVPDSTHEYSIQSGHEGLYYGGTITIITYGDNIKLHINNEAELPSNLTAESHKTETLYFIYTSGDERYQYAQSFNVYPKWYKIDTTSAYKNELGNIEFVVENYSKYTENYIITKTNWGGNIRLVNYDNKNTPIANIGDTLSSSSIADKNYYFDYEINNDISGGAGAAYINDRGNIVTSPEFDVTTGTITINVYMKVSGADGRWNQSSTRRLGQLRISLKQGQGETTSTPNDILIGTVNTSESTEKKFAAEIGEEVNLKELLDANLSNIIDNNSHYHVVYDGSLKITDNMDHWTFTTTGLHSLTVRETGCTPSLVQWTYEYTLPFYVYDTTNVQTQYIYLPQGETYTYNENTYTLENNVLTSVGGNNETAENLGGVGRHERDIITISGNTATLTKYVFYVVDAPVEASCTFNVAKTATAEWKLAYLSSYIKKQFADYPNVSAYYDVTDEGLSTSESKVLSADLTEVTKFTTITGNAETRQYIVKMGDKYVRIVVNFLKVPDKPTSVGKLKQGGSTFESTIRSDFTGYSITGVYEYESGGNGVLKSVNEDSTARVREVIIVTSTGNFRRTYTFFPYAQTATLNLTIPEDAAYSLANDTSLRAYLLEQFGLTGETISTYRFNVLTGTTLTEVVSISTEEYFGETVTYLVNINGTYYKVTITFAQQTA